MSESILQKAAASLSTCNSSTTSTSPISHKYILHLIPSRESVLETCLMNTRSYVTQKYGEDSTFRYPLHCSLTSFFDNAGQSEDVIIDLFCKAVESILQVGIEKKSSPIQENLFSIIEQQPAVANTETNNNNTSYNNIKNSRVIHVSVAPHCPPESSHIVLPVDCPLARQVAERFAEILNKCNSKITVRLKRASHMSLGHRLQTVVEGEENTESECHKIKTAFGQSLRSIFNSQYSSFKLKDEYEKNKHSWDLILLKQIETPPSRFEPRVEHPGEVKNKFCVAPVCRVEGFALTHFVSSKEIVITKSDAQKKAQAIFNHSVEISSRNNDKNSQQSHTNRKSSIFNCTTVTSSTTLAAAEAK